MAEFPEGVRLSRFVEEGKDRVEVPEAVVDSLRKIRIGFPDNYFHDYTIEYDRLPDGYWVVSVVNEFGRTGRAHETEDTLLIDKEGRIYSVGRKGEIGEYGAWENEGEYYDFFRKSFYVGGKDGTEVNLDDVINKKVEVTLIESRNGVPYFINTQELKKGDLIFKLPSNPQDDLVYSHALAHVSDE